jgi:hypothetical protein
LLKSIPEKIGTSHAQGQRLGAIIKVDLGDPGAEGIGIKKSGINSSTWTSSWLLQTK